MKCSSCKSAERGRVLETRFVADGLVMRRRRACDCGNRWTTFEASEDAIGSVEKLISNATRSVQKALTNTTRSVEESASNAIGSVENIDENATGSVGGVGGGLPPVLSLVPGSSSDPSRQSGSERVARTRKSKPDASALFVAFWDAYPRKAARLHALKMWQRHGCDALATEIMAALEWQVPIFVRRDPEAVPHAGTWLNGRRWEDERQAAVAAVPVKAQQGRDAWAELLAEETNR
jgi:hypothetical protein